MTFTRLLALLISGVLHPLLVPAYGFAVYISANEYLFSAGEAALPQKGFAMLKVLLLTAFFPAFSIGLMKALGLVAHADLRRREDRILPYVATGFFYIWAYTVYRRTQEPEVFQAILLGACIAVFAGLLLNAVWGKVSMHANGAAALATTVLLLYSRVPADLSALLMLSVLAAGLVGSARLILGAHTPRELAMGYLLGYMSTSAGFLIAGA
jgi:membrane-associated phospholipid phosphatase